ncbi:hypothetical protein R8Z50_23325 [Longispora sp. K20-0274]|uniref:hypothetical protein n=1 Tax=Longispora sp. K20-0274 TaxID=3088255 RepID=UPI00399B118E
MGLITGTALRAGAFATVVFGLTVGAELLFLTHQSTPGAVTAWLAGSAGALVAMMTARVLRVPVRRPLLWIVAGQTLAVTPHIALASGVRGWAGTFLGHLALDGGTGAVLGWLAVLAVLAAGYATHTTLAPASAAQPARR